MTEHGTALVTGASSGIGAVYADRLAHRGHDLLLIARDAARMETLAERLHGETGRAIEVLRADLTTREDIDAVAARLANDTDITMLVNNAGMSLPGSVLDADADALSQIVALNVTAPTVLASAAGKAFAARGAGAIISISSVLAVAPEKVSGVYSGSKAYVLNLSLALAAQLQDRGVRVQAVLPGATRTEIWARSGKDIDAFPVEQVMDAGDLVDAALKGFDAGETVTIPPLEDLGLWAAYDDARKALGPHLSQRAVATRYR